MLRAVGSESLSMTRMRTFTFGSSDCVAILLIADKTLGLRKVQIQTVSSIALECVGFAIYAFCLLYLRSSANGWEGRLPTVLSGAGTRVSNRSSRRQGSGWSHRADRPNALRSEGLPRYTLACAYPPE